MGRRKHRARTPSLWIATNKLPRTGGHPFYQRLNQVLDTHAFDEFVEAQCAPFYAAAVGRPSLTPGTYFRLLLIGYFEGIDSERGIMWRTADSLALRGFLGLGLDEVTPEHSTISRTRRLIDVETHRAVFTWILHVLATADLIRGKTIGIDATTLEANAALLRSIVRRDSGETYQEFLTQLAQASGMATPTRADSARLDRTRPTKGRNTDWRHPHDPDARITKMKDGRTHLAHKAEHAVDLETGGIVGVTVQGADQGETTTIADPVTAAAEDLEAVATVTDEPTSVIEDVVADKGYHSNQVLVDLAALDLRTYIAEPQRGRRRWTRTATARDAVYANRRRIRRARGRALQRQRSERLERPSLRDRGPAADTSARAPQHPQTTARPHGRLQLRPAHANADRRGHAAWPPGAQGGGLGARRRRVDLRGRPLAPRSHPIRRPRARRHTASSFRTISSPRGRRGRLTTGC